MKSILFGAAASLTVAMSNQAIAQSSAVPASDPTVMVLIGDVDSKDARKIFRKHIKKKPKKKQCLAAEWEKLGYRHAYYGMTVYEGVAKTTERCVKKHGVSFDRARYEAGHREGVIMFCGYERGIRIGWAASKSAEMVAKEKSFCGDGLYPNFETGYRVGQELNGIIKEKNRLLNAIPEAQAAFDTYYLEVVDGDRSFEVRRRLGELERDIENTKTAHRMAKDKIEGFKTKYHAGKIFEDDLPDAELDYTIPTFP